MTPKTRQWLKELFDLGFPPVDCDGGSGNCSRMATETGDNCDADVAAEVMALSRISETVFSRYDDVVALETERRDVYVHVELYASIQPLAVTYEGCSLTVTAQIVHHWDYTVEG